MNQTPDKLWQAFETLAKQYPHDDGVRITAPLARWLVEERQRLRVPAPPILENVAQTVAKVIAAPDF